MDDLAQLIVERVATGLKRQALTTCSRWAETYRVLKTKPFPGPWTWKYHPWLKEMHDSTASKNVGQKAAQLGFTEWALNTTFFKIDIENTDCLYVLPTEGDASDFSAGRFDPALEASAFLRSMFVNVKNVGHKRAGQNNLYVRGSRSRGKLKSIPCGFIVFDEVDEMEQKNIPLALERASGHLEKQILMISTPTLDGIGINKQFQLSTQEEFFFKCPHCGRLTEFVFPDCLVITADKQTDPEIEKSHYICKECKHRLSHKNKTTYLQTGRFVPAYSDRSVRGFHVNQFYSATIKPVDLAIAALKADLDPTDATELNNSKLGRTYQADGSQVTDTDIEKCIGNFKKGYKPQQLVTMGVDIGRLLHYEIDSWVIKKTGQTNLDINDVAEPFVVAEGTVNHFEELDLLMQEYGVLATVVDRYPETREAYRFATRFWGRVLLCMYGRGMFGKQVQLGTDEERTITVDRTSWLDLSLGRFRNNTIHLPINTSEEYKKHIKEPIRVYLKDNNGNPVGRYTNSGPDHFAHARNYAELALPLAASFGQSQDITKVY